MEPTTTPKPARTTIWTYWETLPGKTKPAHIELSHEALKRNCGADIDVRVLGPDDIRELDLDLHPRWRELEHPAHRADYLRTVLIHRFGGFWVDSDVITLRSFGPAASLLEAYDFVAWEYRSGTNGQDVTYRVPIGCFGAKAGSLLLTRWLEAIHRALENVREPSWHALGRELMNPLLKDLVTSKQLTYYAIHAENTIAPIKCKQRNQFFEAGDATPYIHHEPLQPIIFYFNSWMPQLHKMSRERILNGEEVICRLFQHALRP
jgi:hypothetical protein